MKKMLLMSMLATLIFSGSAFAAAENQPADEKAPKANLGQEMTEEKAADNESATPAEAAKKQEQNQHRNMQEETAKKNM